MSSVLKFLFNDLDGDQYSLSYKLNEYLTTSEDINLSELDLSYRSYNTLSELGIKTISQLLAMDISTLNSTRKLGKKSINEILKVLKRTVVLNKNLLDINQRNIIKDIFRGSDYRFIYNEHKFIDCIARIINTRNIQIENIEDLKTLSNDSYLQKYFEECLLYWIGRFPSGISRAEILDIFYIGEDNYITDVMSLIWKLKSEDKILSFNRKYYLFRSNIQDYINTIIDYRDRSLLEQRLYGRTLQEIGLSLDLTRERIRQKLNRLLDAVPPLNEDVYSEIFSKYNFSTEIFCKSFGLSHLSYYYLKYKYSVGDVDICSLFTDNSIDSEIKQKIKNQAEQIILFLDDGSCIKKHRNSIVEYLITKHCQKEINFEDFHKIYLSFLEEHNLLSGEYYYDKRVLENKISSSNKTLWKYKKNFRYFDIENVNIDELFRELEIEKFNDSEISTNIFFIKYPEVLSKYSILDEYELHNLIRKKLELGYHHSFLKIEAGRQPNIFIGESDRARQVLMLLKQLSPISVDDFIDAYYQTFGVKKNTFFANGYLNNISKYLHNNEYVIDLPTMSDDELQYMREKLTADIYTVDDFHDIYSNRFLNSDSNKVNSLNFAKLGFKLISSFLIKRPYFSLENYVTSKLIEQDIIDFTGQLKSLCKSRQFSFLKHILLSHGYIEFEYNKFVSLSSLSKFNVTSETIKDFVNDALSFANKNFFTYKFLLNNGFSHSLQLLGFDDYFYESILRKDHRIAYIKHMNQYIFKETCNDIDLCTFIHSCFDNAKSIKIYKLISHARNKYSVELEKNKILQAIKNTHMYYSDIFETIYLDQEDFYKEI